MEPVSLADIKRHLVLEASDTSEDDYLEALITAARRMVELRTNRKLVGNLVNQVLGCFPDGAIALGDERVASATVTYLDLAGTAQVLDDGGGFTLISAVIPALLIPDGSWPATADRPDAVTVSYQVAAIDPADEDVVAQAIRLIVGHWYANREAVVADGRSVAAELPLAVTWLLDPLRRWATD